MMKSAAKKVARFGVLTALAFVLGWADRAIPVSVFLSGAVPGLKLGLANTVLLYAVYLMDVRSSFLLMLAKVLLSGLLFGSPSAMLYSFAGGILSLLVMLAAKRKAAWGSAAAFAVCAACEGMLLSRYTAPRGQVLLSMILIAAAGIGLIIIHFCFRNKSGMGVISTSVAGAIAHNIGQILMAAWTLQTPQLLWSYLPFLAGLGAVVGSMTGIIAQRVFHAIRFLSAERDIQESKSEHISERNL